MFPDKMSSLPTPMRSRKDIQEEALCWCNVPWKHQGRTRKGIDCVGLAMVVARELQLPYEDVTGYNRRAANYDFVEEFRKQTDEVILTQKAPGDIVCFRDYVYPCHCGILVDLYKDGTLYFIHAYATHRKVVVESLTEHWLGKMTHAFQYRGII